MDIKALENMHGMLLEALRHREQEILSYLTILVPALGGFGWLLYYAGDRATLFVFGTVGVLLLLGLGAVYSLTLGYNYRYITLQLAKIEHLLGIKEAMLTGWPKSRKDFLKRYRKFRCLPWCTPPEMIKVFWRAFLCGIILVTAAAGSASKGELTKAIIISAGGLCLLVGFFYAAVFGYKLIDKCEREQDWPDRLPVVKDQ